jgi:hypothetical protein
MTKETVTKHIKEALKDTLEQSRLIFPIFAVMAYFVMGIFVIAWVCTNYSVLLGLLFVGPIEVFILLFIVNILRVKLI